METEETKPQNKIQEYIEKRKTEQAANEREEMAQNEEVKQKREQNKQKLKGIADKVGDTIKTGATVVSAIPHAVAFTVGAGAGSLIPKILEEWWEKKQKEKK